MNESLIKIKISSVTLPIDGKDQTLTFEEFCKCEFALCAPGPSEIKLPGESEFKTLDIYTNREWVSLLAADRNFFKFVEARFFFDFPGAEDLLPVWTEEELEEINNARVAQW